MNQMAALTERSPTMRRRDQVWPPLIALVAGICVVLVLLDATLPGRATLVLAFSTVCPGMALIRLLRLSEPLTEFLLAIVVSLALAAVVPSITVYLGAWSAELSLLVIVALTLAAVLFDLLRSNETVG
jgi:hypothetical protein